MCNLHIQWQLSTELKSLIGLCICEIIDREIACYFQLQVVKWVERNER